MLRDFQYDIPEKFIKILPLFDLNLKGRKVRISLLKFEVLSPDSFFWNFTLDDEEFYLYAEDAILSFNYIKETLQEIVGHNSWELVKCTNPKPFNESSPVAAARFYKEPDDADELMQYAVDSGYDFVFLARKNK